MQTENPGGSTDEKTEDNVWIRSDKSALGSRSSGVRDVWTMSGSLSCLRSDHLSNKDCIQKQAGLIESLKIVAATFFVYKVLIYFQTNTEDSWTLPKKMNVKTQMSVNDVPDIFSNFS
ncbi:hypothetical protein F2P81_016463 [Scophthalmus maximus]|uniref:Uncharacterized protein n=1 Tax=Scophthalmus maximus TaxID=52904 RepID=A0A6A4SI69_SCOMX|nr:hypothetical protein F2P81_016463 [Scophthalmus maximus]